MSGPRFQWGNTTNSVLRLSAACLVLLTATTLVAQPQEDASRWTIYITNDNCPDYTWGYTEQQTRKSFADIVRAHLDEMNRTDHQEPANRDRYNMAVTQEALCFLEHYPERKAELIRRIKERRLFISPYLCNTLWAFQSVESAIRSFYPARRLEKQWGIKIDVAEHIEEPSLPWGVAPILSGCGIRWLSSPYLGYDSSFGGLENPPLFTLEGPDGSKVRVILDKWASSKSNYTQGAHLLRNPETIIKEWVPHYRHLGPVYPLGIILASGTHGDISPGSGTQATGFAQAVIEYNARTGPHPKLVNATLPQFCQAVDEVQASRPFMPTIRGCFGHSWDVWPVSLAKYVADMREGERQFLGAEALLAVAALNKPEVHQSTRKDREQAEWYWCMLADHAWNGNSEQNKRHNAQLRKKWSQQLRRPAHELLERAWSGTGLRPGRQNITIFNSLSFPRKSLVRIKAPEGINIVAAEAANLGCQSIIERGERILYFISPEIAGFGFGRFRLKHAAEINPKTDRLLATPTQLENTYYLLKVDTATGGICSLVHKATGAELVVPGTGRSLCQTVYFDSRLHTLKNVESRVVANGPVLARLKIAGSVDGIEVTNFVTIYADLDQVDFDLHIHKPPTTKQQRLCQIFPVLAKGAVLRIETTGAVLRPRPQPEGDLLAGADTRRFAVQGFLNASLPNGLAVTIAPLDAFVLRLDLDPITFESLGNDQNYREVVLDQDGVTHFRFRYALRAHARGYKGAEVFTWSRSAASPLLAAFGSIPESEMIVPRIEIDPTRAIATCLKPADDGASEGSILRLWEVAGSHEPFTVGLQGYEKVILTDLLERNCKELRIVNRKVTVNPNPNGFCALRLLP